MRITELSRCLQLPALPFNLAAQTLVLDLVSAQNDPLILDLLRKLFRIVRLLRFVQNLVKITSSVRNLKKMNNEFNAMARVLENRPGRKSPESCPADWIFPADDSHARLPVSFEILPLEMLTFLK